MSWRIWHFAIIKKLADGTQECSEDVDIDYWSIESCLKVCKLVPWTSDSEHCRTCCWWHLLHGPQTVLQWSDWSQKKISWAFDYDGWIICLLACQAIWNIKREHEQLVRAPGCRNVWTNHSDENVYIDDNYDKTHCFDSIINSVCLSAHWGVKTVYKQYRGSFNAEYIWIPFLSYHFIPNLRSCQFAPYLNIMWLDFMMQ